MLNFNEFCFEPPEKELRGFLITHIILINFLLKICSLATVISHFRMATKASSFQALKTIQVSSPLELQGARSSSSHLMTTGSIKLSSTHLDASHLMEVSLQWVSSHLRLGTQLQGLQGIPLAYSHSLLEHKASLLHRTWQVRESRERQGSRWLFIRLSQSSNSRCITSNHSQWTQS